MSSKQGFIGQLKYLGAEHVYIKLGTPSLKGKIERSLLTDKRERYQMLDYTDDVNLHKKFANGRTIASSQCLMLYTWPPYGQIKKRLLA